MKPSISSKAKKPTETVLPVEAEDAADEKPAAPKAIERMNKTELIELAITK